MKVAIVGYGKMGKEIEKVLLSRGHSIVAKASQDNPLTLSMIKEADVAIEFSTPHSVLDNIDFLINNNIPTIVGTTGWNEAYKQVENLVNDKNGALVHASNFSIGVNLFFQLNEQLAQLMSSYTDYHPEIVEIHHTEKLDAPSGTAISLAEGLLRRQTKLTDWHCVTEETKDEKQKESSLVIEAIRQKDVKGLHRIEYKSEIDTISIQHEAHNRTGFSLGAVIAAEWILNKRGIFTMKDVLQLS